MIKISGLITTIIGILISLTPIFTPKTTFLLIYGIPITIIGLIIIFNKKEDQIEPIKK